MTRLAATSASARGGDADDTKRREVRMPDWRRESVAAATFSHDRRARNDYRARGERPRVAQPMVRAFPHAQRRDVAAGSDTRQSGTKIPRPPAFERRRSAPPSLTEARRRLVTGADSARPASDRGSGPATRSGRCLRQARAIARSRAMRSSVAGCVLNSRATEPPCSGLMIIICAVAGCASAASFGMPRA